jgi:hypothetical protein
VPTEPELQLSVRRAPRDVEPIGLLVHRRVAVRSREVHRDERAGRDGHAAHLDVTHRAMRPWRTTGS